MEFMLIKICITFLYHTIKIEFFFFGISSLISWANTLEIRGFLPKIKNFHHHSKFFMRFIMRKIIINSLHYTVKIKYFNFFWIISLILWANIFKTQEFRQNVENFHHHSNSFMLFIMRNYYYNLSSSYHSNRKF